MRQLSAHPRAGRAFVTPLARSGIPSGPARVPSTFSGLEIGKLGEFGLLAELERLGLAGGLDAEGAVLAGGVVVTQDTLVEGVHFRREWTSWRDLGWKAAAVNLSDLAALGAEPEALLVGLAKLAKERIGLNPADTPRRRSDLVELNTVAHGRPHDLNAPSISPM